MYLLGQETSLSLSLLISRIELWETPYKNVQLLY